MHTHISQAYFEGGAYVGDDCCEDRYERHVVAQVYENGARIMEVDFQYRARVRRGDRRLRNFADRVSRVSPMR
jgi:hypothetical protein